VLNKHSILVIADRATPQLAMLEQLPKGISITIGESPGDFAHALEDADAIFNWALNNATLRDIFGKCPRLRWVHTRLAGLDNLLFPELVASSVTLTNGRGVFSQSLGEFALAAILFFAKDLRRMIRAQAERKWDQFDATEIAGQTVSIIGYGDIGLAAATRARALGMRVLAVRRSAAGVDSDPVAHEVHGRERLREVISRSDYVVVAAPLTPETRGLVGAAEIAAMKPGAVLINVGRGPVLDETALIEALEQGRIRGAALDVFNVEPLPTGHPFYSLENVLLSPHCADHTATWTDDSMRFFVAQAERYSKGEPLQSVVKKQLGY
jgi:phosphoglycerate dehydrogenase-like enzyme